MVLGERLKQLRQEKGLTQAQLGAYFNLAESSISLYEAGKRSPDYATLKRLAAFFAVSADYLLGYPDSAQLSKETPPPYGQEPRPQPLPVVSPLKGEDGTFGWAETGRQEWYLAGAAAGQLFWYEITSDTLIGEGILPGDLALIEEGMRQGQGQLVLVYLSEEGLFLFCRVFRQDSVLVLQCGNPLNPPRIFSGKEISKVKFIGTIKEIRRKY